MVICRDILASFTVMFAALSFVFTVAATTGEYWIVYTFYGSRRVYGLWKYCIGIYRKKDCTQNPLAKGNYLVADVGMVAACVLLFLGLIISLVMKFSKLSQKGYTNLGGILTFTLFLGATVEITALSCFTVETNKAVNRSWQVYYGWSYVFGWLAVAFLFLCGGSGITSIFKKPNVQASNNMQAVVPIITSSSVPYEKFNVSTPAPNKI